MRIVLDLDGTIIVYYEVFHRHAVAGFDHPQGVPIRKNSVRDWLRRNEPGEQWWTALQRPVYGPKILEAAPAAGVTSFLVWLREAGAEIAVVSDKARYSAAASPVDLRAAASEWLEVHGLVGASGPVDHVEFSSRRPARRS